jgi:hypothetical protein
MNENITFQRNVIADREQELKEEEFLNTIKMEPILATTEIEEEEQVTKKIKRIRFTDYCLLSMIVVLSVVFIMVLFKVM